MIIAGLKIFQAKPHQAVLRPEHQELQQSESFFEN